MKKLSEKETELRGDWVLTNGRMEADEVCQRIDWLIQNSLELISKEDWSAIYSDPSDGRCWKLEYRQSHMHGGGPPTLSMVPQDENDANAE